MKEIVSYECSTCGKKFDLMDECINHELKVHKTRKAFIKENNLRIVYECCGLCSHYNCQVSMCRLLSEKSTIRPTVDIRCVCDKFSPNKSIISDIKTRMYDYF